MYLYGIGRIDSEFRADQAPDMAVKQGIDLSSEVYPDLSERVPQRHIATYLGIAPESLSRIRGAMKEA
jgi:CRP-like cAMP-binding protein